MCSNEQQPTPSAYMANLRQPMPVRLKVKLLVRNSWLRVAKRQTCCGHPGEPGC